MMAAADERGQLRQKREGRSSGREVMAVVTLVASDKRRWQQQEAMLMRSSNNSRVTMMSMVVTTADKRRQQWGTTGDGNSGCIRQKVPAVVKNPGVFLSTTNHN